MDVALGPGSLGLISASGDLEEKIEIGRRQNTGLTGGLSDDLSSDGETENVLLAVEKDLGSWVRPSLWRRLVE